MRVPYVGDGVRGRERERKEHHRQARSAVVRPGPGYPGAGRHPPHAAGQRLVPLAAGRGQPGTTRTRVPWRGQP
eukprot:627282-Prorocentrum_minimum.AAC.1